MVVTQVKANEVFQLAKSVGNIEQVVVAEINFLSLKIRHVPMIMYLSTGYLSQLAKPIRNFRDHVVGHIQDFEIFHRG